jgi:hypothetical protein
MSFGKPKKHEWRRNGRRNSIQIMVARPKDWRRVAARSVVHASGKIITRTQVERMGTTRAAFDGSRDVLLDRLKGAMQRPLMTARSGFLGPTL